MSTFVIHKGMRTASLITAINVLASAGFAIAGVARPEAIMPAGYVSSAASAMFAMYGAARAIPLALVASIVIFRGNPSSLIVIGALAGLIQLSDALIGLWIQDPTKVVGPLVLAGLQLYAIWRVLRHGEANR